MYLILLSVWSLPASRGPHRRLPAQPGGMSLSAPR